MFRSFAVGLFLSSFLVAPASRAGEIAGLEIVTGDPAAEAIVARLQALAAGARIEVLAKSVQVNPVTGYEYTLLKVRSGDRDLTAVLNETTGTFATDRGLADREAEELLAALPKVYRRMGYGLLARVRQAQGGTLGVDRGMKTPLDVTFHAASKEALDAIEVALGSASRTRLDVPSLFEKAPPVFRPSKDGEVEHAGAPSVRVIRTTVPLADVLRVASLPGVVHVELTGLKTPDLDQAVPRVRANVVKGFGLSGANTDIGIVDSGVDNTHPDLDIPLFDIDLVIAEADFTGAGGADPSDDTGGHGTHVAGCAINTSAAFEGMAPLADVISAKVNSGGPNSGADATINSGIAWARSSGADVLNGSFSGLPTGGVTGGQDPTSRQFDYEVYTSNVTSCVTIGNTGIQQNRAPADAFNVITVGSTNLANNPSTVSTFSTFGPMADARSKPDVLAPGEGSGGGPPPDAIDSTAFNWEGANPDFRDRHCSTTTSITCTVNANCPGGEVCSSVNGTSFAAPLVAGLASLLWDWGGGHGILRDTPILKAAILNNANRLAGWVRPGFGQPLDPMQGTGEIESAQTFRAYADDLRIWQQRVTGTDPEDSHWYWIDVTGAPVNLVPTLVWERHVTNSEAVTPGVMAPALNDLDLWLYDPAGSNVDRSTSSVDSVEHIVYNAPANGRYCVEVDPYTLGAGAELGAELYALAASRPPDGNVRDFRLNFLGNTNPCVPDFGDAPDPPYPSLLASNGARHLDWTKEWLGTSRPEIEGELRKVPLGAVASRVDPFPSVSGEADAVDPADQDGIVNLVNHDAWDDGVVIPGPFLPGVPKVIKVTVQCTVDDTGVGTLGRYDAAVPTKRLYLNGWADWNGNGIWADGGEKILGTLSPTGQLAIDPATFGTNGRYTIGESFTDSNGSGRWEPDEPFTDAVGVTQRTFSYVVTPPPFIAPSFYLRFRVDYGEDVGVVANVSGNLAQFVGEAQLGEVEDYNQRYEIDVFPRTTALFDLRMPDTSPTPHIVELTGPSVVQVDLGTISDTDGDGREQVPTQMTHLDLRGASPTFGSVQVHLRDPGQDPFLLTTGEIEESSNVNTGTLDLEPFTTSPAGLDADSHFDVTFEVFLPDLAMTLHSHAPKRMRGKIRHKPPRERDTYYNPLFTPLYDQNDALVAAVGPGYHMPSTPQRPPEIDLFPESTARVDLRFPPGGPSTIVNLTGPSVVSVDLPGISDSDNDGLEQVTTEMLDLDLHGFHPSFGGIIVRERSASVHPFMPTVGEIEENVNVSALTLDLPPFTTSPSNLTASTYFNVFLEIELPDQGMTLHTHAPKRMSATIRHKPPAPGDQYENPLFIPLFDEEENYVADVGPGLHVPHPSPLVPGAGNVTVLMVGKAGPFVILNWNPSCDSTDTDYAVYVGNLGNYYTHNAFQCSTGGNTSFQVPPSTGRQYYLVVPREGPLEGSYGRRSGGIERPQGLGACGQRQISCP